MDKYILIILGTALCLVDSFIVQATFLSYIGAAAFCVGLKLVLDNNRKGE